MMVPTTPTAAAATPTQDVIMALSMPTLAALTAIIVAPKIAVISTQAV